jgi:hypothetical protein
MKLLGSATNFKSSLEDKFDIERIRTDRKALRRKYAARRKLIIFLKNMI